MNKDDVIEKFTAFFSGNEPFNEIRELQGHAASSIPEIFYAWFSNFSDDDRRFVASILIESIVAGQRFEEYLPRACILAGMIARREPSVLSGEPIMKVERLVDNQEVINAWLNDVEDQTDHPKPFRQTWQYGLMIWNLLWETKSPLAEKIFFTLTENARDEEFVRALKRVRQPTCGLQKIKYNNRN